MDQRPTDATCLFLDKSDGEFSTNDNHTFVQSNSSPTFVVLLFTFKLLNLLALGLTVVTLVASCNPDLLKDDLQTGITFTLDQNGSSSYYSWDQMNSRGIHTPTNKKYFLVVYRNHLARPSFHMSGLKGNTLTEESTIIK